ncbi:response regulator transcription factor [Spirochaeta lutea]|uniref:response regulator transcription factor n=1 Tax=Spirochaeta lutea TaxID=1480694 RepID=UPI00068D02C5|nr:response regulator transcription factor [Spirochaeta lutea]
MSKRIVLVDDQRLFLESLRVVIENNEPELQVVALGEDGHQAVELADEQRPDIMLMDVRMPGMNGVEAVRIIKQRHPAIRIIMLTTFEDDEYVRHALSYGASGYLLKNIPTSELIASIRAALSGAVSIDPRVVPSLLTSRGSADIPGTAIGPESSPGIGEPGGVSTDSGSSGKAGYTGSGEEGPVPPGRRVSPGPRDGSRMMGAGHSTPGSGNDLPWVDELTRKERQILGLMVRGFTNPEIADQVCIAEQTVRNYVSRIYSKLEVTNRVQAVRRARESRLF